MAQRFRLIVTVVVLCGLQAPLCALACLDGSADATQVAQHGEPPSCHEREQTHSEPAGPSHEDCECAQTDEALIAGPLDLPSGSQTWSLVRSGALVPPALRDAYSLRGPAGATDLPPPDILRLNSILII